DDEDSFLPPLLKRLPKDFGGGPSMDYDDDDDDDDESGDFGTMIVKSDRSRQRDRSSSGLTSPVGSTRKTGSSYKANPLNDEDDDEDD
ncbi:serine/threonine-protein kinase dst1-like, partial [Trifolium medium]|nr:serine/threonine-protein kinase dst1-like [Trifolium medium]